MSAEWVWPRLEGIYIYLPLCGRKKVEAKVMLSSNCYASSDAATNVFASKVATEWKVIIPCQKHGISWCTQIRLC